MSSFSHMRKVAGKGVEDRVRQHIDEGHDIVTWDRLAGRTEDETRGWQPVVA